MRSNSTRLRIDDELREELLDELALLREDVEELEQIDRDGERVELIAGITLSVVLLLLAASPLIVGLLDALRAWFLGMA